MPKKEKKEFSFISEQIKKKPFYKKKWFVKSSAAIGLALIFGAVAGASFAAVTPWAKKQFLDPESLPRVVITQEEETEKVTEKHTDVLATEEETEKQELVPETIVEKKELEISDYKKLYSMMKTVANDTFRSVVNVSGHASEESWFKTELETESAGLILAQDDTSLYIVTEKSAVTETSQILVTLTDGSTTTGEIQRVDSLSGLAVIKAPINKLSEQSLRYVRAASLGTTSSALQGSPVMLLGSRYEAGTTMNFGMVNAVVPVSTSDREYKLLETNITGKKVPGGILVNMEGKVVGILAEGFRDKEEVFASALAISEIKVMLEGLTNNIDTAYIGITGKDVTEQVSKANDIPQGISIHTVAADSPAMYAGVQPADVLTAVNDKSVTDMKTYVEILQDLKPGDTAKLTLMRKGIESMYVEISADVTIGSTN